MFFFREGAVQRIVADDFLVVLFHPPLLLPFPPAQLLVQSDRFLTLPLELALEIVQLATRKTHLHRRVPFLFLAFLDRHDALRVPAFLALLAPAQFFERPLDDLHFQVEIDELLGFQFEAAFADGLALVLLGHYQVVDRGFAAQAGNLGHVQQIHPVIIITCKPQIAATVISMQIHMD